MSRHPRGVVAGVLLASALVACGGSVSQVGADGGTGHGGSAATEAGNPGQDTGVGVGGQGGGAADVASVCAEYAAAYCAIELKCEPFFASWQWSSDAQRCRDASRRWCRLSVEANGSKTGADWFAGYAAALQGLSCSEWLYSAAGLYVDTRPHGTRPADASCAVGAQCATGWCLLPVGEACGFCVSFAEPGSPCQSDDACLAGYRCIAGSCTLPGGLGQACVAGSYCMQGLTCNAGTCQITPSGGSCPTGWECGGAVNGELCIDGTCQLELMAQPGEACVESAPYCPGRLLCPYGTTCEPPVLAGGACTDSSACELFTYCASGTCTEVPGDCP